MEFTIKSILSLILLLAGLFFYFINFLFIGDVFYLHIAIKYKCFDYLSIHLWLALLIVYDVFTIISIYKKNPKSFIKELIPNLKLFGSLILVLVFALIFKVGKDDMLIVAIIGIFISYLQTVVFQYDYNKVTSKYPFSNDKSKMSIVAFCLCALLMGIVMAGSLPSEKSVKRELCLMPD